MVFNVGPLIVKQQAAIFNTTSTIFVFLLDGWINGQTWQIICRQMNRRMSGWEGFYSSLGRTAGERRCIQPPAQFRLSLRIKMMRTHGSVDTHRAEPSRWQRWRRRAMIAFIWYNAEAFNGEGEAIAVKMDDSIQSWPLKYFSEGAERAKSTQTSHAQMWRATFLNDYYFTPVHWAHMQLQSDRPLLACLSLRSIFFTLLCPLCVRPSSCRSGSGERRVNRAVV